ncbi:TPA: hypothetical protein VEM08_000163 [Stenotrophomonas maltophilia]|nr:hypothetical protein [Stenotrophomonas maltophilia]
MLDDVTCKPLKINGKYMLFAMPLDFLGRIYGSPPLRQIKKKAAHWAAFFLANVREMQAVVVVIDISDAGG